jgi:dGTP triphosphohydrolase
MSKARVLWNASINPFLFLVSAMVSGLGLIILIANIRLRYFRKNANEEDLEGDRRVIETLKLMLIVSILIDLFLLASDIVLLGNHTADAHELFLILTTGSFGFWFLGVQIFLGEIVPRQREQLPATLEGQCVRIADIVAYINHDLDDALRSGILTLNDVPQKILSELGETHSKRINTLVVDIIATARSQEPLTLIRFSPRVETLALSLRSFLYEKVYSNPRVVADFNKASKILEELFNYFMDHPSRLPKKQQEKHSEVPHQSRVCDFLAGMTDPYAIQLYHELFLPRSWLVS